VDLPLIKLADFGVSLLTGEGSGPIALMGGRKPSSASMRGGASARSGPGGSRPPARPPATPPVVGEIARAPAPSTAPLTAVAGDEDDDDADTGSMLRVDENDLQTASLPRSALAGGRAARPPVSINPSALSLNPSAVSIPPSAVSMSNMPTPSTGVPVALPLPSSVSAEPKTMELGAVTPEAEARAAAIAASLEAADARTSRPSQTSMSDLLAAAHDESVVVSGMLTQTDTLIGTPMYMAPELWNSGSHRAEPLSDIFSIGVIAFELLTGRMPFAVPPVMARANDEPIYIARLTQVRADLDARLIALVESCLALTPESRPRARELHKRLIELGALSPEG
jgi:serine/threonine protein kinase